MKLTKEERETIQHTEAEIRKLISRFRVSKSSPTTFQQLTYLEDMWRKRFGAMPSEVSERIKATSRRSASRLIEALCKVPKFLLNLQYGYPFAG